jgi:hypothetical protein
MQLDDILAQSGGLSSIARELGISEQQVRAGAAALMPAIVGGFAKQAQPAGAGLGDLLGQLGGSGLLDDLVSPQPTDIGRGNQVLGNIFGTKDVSRAVAQHAAAQSGLDPSLLRKLLPMLAMLAVGYMAKRHGQARNAPAPGQVTTGVNGNGNATTQANGGGFGGLGDILGGLLGGGKARPGGLGAIFDKDGNGNPLDDILRKVGMAGR